MRYEALNDEQVADLLARSSIRNTTSSDSVDLQELADSDGQIFVLVTSMGGGGFLLPKLVLV